MCHDGYCNYGISPHDVSPSMKGLTLHLHNLKSTSNTDNVFPNLEGSLSIPFFTKVVQEFSNIPNCLVTSLDHHYW
jgi:hypothetical protein